MKKFILMVLAILPCFGQITQESTGVQKISGVELIPVEGSVLYGFHADGNVVAFMKVDSENIEENRLLVNDVIFCCSDMYRKNDSLIYRFDDYKKNRVYNIELPLNEPLNTTIKIYQRTL